MRLNEAKIKQITKHSTTAEVNVISMIDECIILDLL